MKIAMISGSPRDNSVSMELISRMRAYFPSDDTKIFQIREGTDLKSTAAAVAEYDALVLETPLYLDGMPSVLLRFLGELEFYARGKKPMIASVHCGFYEGSHCETALMIAENWADHAGYDYKGGIGIGAAGALSFFSTVSTGKGALRKIGQGFETLAAALNNGRCENMFVSVSIPRFIYKAAAEAGWRREIRRNGLEAKDLDNRMTEVRERRKKENK